MTTKIIIGILALILGISAVWTVRILVVSSRSPETVVSPSSDAAVPSPDEINKIQIRFIGFEFHKDWAARFAISNYTAKPILYIGFRDKTHEYGFCTLAAQRAEKYEPTGVDTRAWGLETRSGCWHSKAVVLQTLEPNESAIFAVDKFEVQNLVRLDGKYKNAQIGFEFFVGDEKRRELIWSQDITFPENLSE